MLIHAHAAAQTRNTDLPNRNVNVQMVTQYARKYISTQMCTRMRTCAAV
jgi:hypothetical protein